MAAERIELGQEPVWEIQFDETPTQYRAFCLYRDLLDERSLTKVAQKWSNFEQAADQEEKPKRGSAGQPMSRLSQWSAKNRWVERAEAYDLHLDRKFRESRENAMTRMIATETQLGRTLVSASLRRFVGFEDKDNPEKSVEAIDLNKVTPAEAVMMAREGVNISRKSTGRPTELVRGALFISGTEYQQDMGEVIEISLAYIPEHLKPAYAEEIRAFSAGERQKAIAG